MSSKKINKLFVLNGTELSPFSRRCCFEASKPKPYSNTFFRPNIRYAAGFVFFLIIFFCTLAYAEISRKELISYTLDYYAEETQANAKKEEINKSMQDTQIKINKKTKQENNIPGIVTPKNKSKKLEDVQLRKIQMENKQTKKQTIEPKQKPDTQSGMARFKPVRAKVIRQEPSRGVVLSFGSSQAKKKQLDMNKDKEKNVKSAEKINKEKNESETQRIKQEKKPGVAGYLLRNTHPYIRASETYDDNLYDVKSDVQSDYITKLYPGLKFYSKIAHKKAEVSLDGGLEVLKYGKTRQNNDESFYGSGKFKYGLGRFGIAASGGINKSRGLPSILLDSSQKSMIDSWNRNSLIDSSINLGRMNIGVQYYHGETLYEDDQYKTNDYFQDTVALRDSVKLTSKTDIFAEYAHGWLNYFKNTSTSYSYDKYWIGLNGKIFSKIEGLVKVGYGMAKRKTLKDVNGSLLNLRLNYKQTRRLNYSLDIIRGLGGYGTIDAPVDKVKGVILGCSYLPPFSKRLRLSGNVSYFQRGSDYQTRENYLGISLGPQYVVNKWLLLAFAYNYDIRKSKSQNNDFVDSAVSLRLNSEF